MAENSEPPANSASPVTYPASVLFCHSCVAELALLTEPTTAAAGATWLGKCNWCCEHRWVKKYAAQSVDPPSELPPLRVLAVPNSLIFVRADRPSVPAVALTVDMQRMTRDVLFCHMTIAYGCTLGDGGDPDSSAKDAIDHLFMSERYRDQIIGEYRPILESLWPQ